MNNDFAETNTEYTEHTEITTLAASNCRLVGRQLFNYLLATLFILAASVTGMATANEAKLQLADETKNHLADLPAIETAENSPLRITENRVTIVTFFASWCPPCRDEFHALNEVKEQFGNDISIVAVNAFEPFDSNDEARMERFLIETNPTFPLVEGNAETLKLFGNVNRIPTLYVFDQNGRQAFNFIHARGATKRSAGSDELIGAIQPLL